MNGRDDKPEWWRENERIRTEMELPAYRPPRFEDGTHTHDVTDRIEDAYGCRVQFIGVNTRYLDDWEVRIDGTPAFGIGRRRDEQGNTVYEMLPETFRDAVEDHLDDD